MLEEMLEKLKNEVAVTREEKEIKEARIKEIEHEIYFSHNTDLENKQTKHNK